MTPHQVNRKVFYIEDVEPEGPPPEKFDYCSALIVCGVLVVLVLGYTALGGWTFRKLEQGPELERCQANRKLYIKSVKNLARTLHNLSRSQHLSENETRSTLRTELDAFRRELQNGKIDFSGKMNRPCSPDSSPWTFVGSSLFAITVTTTIGFGHIAPSTTTSRLICILYACVGMPLMLVCLAKLGDLMARLFTLFHANVLCCGALRPADEELRWERIRRRKEQELEQLLRREDAAEAKTLSSGDGCIQIIGERNGDGTEEEIARKRRRDRIEQLESDIENARLDAGIGESVPLTVSILTIIFYVFLGALTFRALEGWSLVDAAYFSFVSVSTIGLGDMVPGLEVDGDEMMVLKLSVTAVYILLGLAFISMCFTLLQQEVVAKMNYFGRLLGFTAEKGE